MSAETGYLQCGYTIRRTPIMFFQQSECPVEKGVTSPILPISLIMKPCEVSLKVDVWEGSSDSHSDSTRDS
jgi:hypothetical protein